MGLRKGFLKYARRVGNFLRRDVYLKYPDSPKESIRAKLHENLGIRFERVAAGIYGACFGEEGCLAVEGDGRNLFFVKDGSIDCMLTDYPWREEEAGHDKERAFSEYPCFWYTEENFQEKARVLKKGSFMVEILPGENGENYKYLYEMKRMAEENGFVYCKKMLWEKSGFSGNTRNTRGTSRNPQEIIIFSKGKAGIYQNGIPVSLCEQILEFVICGKEAVPEILSGSESAKKVRANKGKNFILIELVKEKAGKILIRVKRTIRKKRGRRLFEEFSGSVDRIIDESVDKREELDEGYEIPVFKL